MAQVSSVVISEWSASGAGDLEDEEGATPDWLELHNTGTRDVPLSGWTLSANSSGTRAWTFPTTNLSAGSRLIVFASRRNRSSPGGPLHTDFNIDADGDSLTLRTPGGMIASEVRFESQLPAHSRGTGLQVDPVPLVSSESPARYHAPLAGDSDLSWRGSDEPFNDAGWMAGKAAVGIDRSSFSNTALLAHWDFNDVSNASLALDRSGEGNHGRLTRATYTASGGGFSGRSGDHALTFAGTGVMSVSNAVHGAFRAAEQNNAITVSLWIRGSARQPTQSSLFWAGSNPDGTGTRTLNVHLPWSDSVIYWDTGCCDTSRQRVSVAEPDPNLWKGRWNHYAFVKNGNLKQIWQNGRLLHEGQNTDPLAILRSFFLGANNANGDSGYHGSVDEVSVWSEALAAPQIAALASGESAASLSEFRSWIGTDLTGSPAESLGRAWLRIPFEVQDPSAFTDLLFRIRYNDGFVAYLNGVELVRRNTPIVPLPDSAATRKRPFGATALAEEWQFSNNNLLRSGRNILAIHGMNHSPTDGTFLMQPELQGARSLKDRLFVTPSPGLPNAPGFAGYSPPVEADVPAGYHSSPVEVNLRTAARNGMLVYTLDGSEPSADHGTATSNTTVRLPLRSTTILRARNLVPDHVPGQIFTRTFLFTADIPAQRRPSGVPSTWPGGQVVDVQIDPRVVRDAEPGYDFIAALKSIPTLSLVTPTEGLFGASTGIYARPENRGSGWERPASAEWIPPNGTGFQIDAGLRIHGGISRSKSFTPKHGFNLNFRGRYGATRLDQAIFPDTEASGFNVLTLRAGSTDTWPSVEWDQLVDGEKRWYRKDATYIRDQFVRDLQLAMGQVSSHGTYVHLYLNGLYWGLYNVCERPDEEFNALHFGGDPSEYDVLSDYVELHHGNLDAWNRLMSLAAADLSASANYQRLLGRNPDGSRNPAYDVLLDPENLADYMILHIYITADDWPAHNWWGARRRGPESTGFKFFAWDQEISNNSVVKQRNSLGQVIHQVDNPNSPAFLYARCRANPEFRQLFADRVQKHLSKRGILATANITRLWDRRVREIDQAIVAESARWGDFQRSTRPYLRQTEWLSHLHWMQTVYFPTNPTIALRRFRTANLFPTLGAPDVSLPPGTISAGSLFLLHTNSSGTIYLTSDGSDPRRLGGAVSPAAVAYSTNSILLRGQSRIRARIRSGSNWSPLLDASYFVAEDYAFLQISEIFYHPDNAGNADGGGAEFLELANLGDVPLSLAGLQFTSGIQHSFDRNSVIPPGGTFILTADTNAFARRFPTRRPDAWYDGRLSNSEETLTLSHTDGWTSTVWKYRDSSDWPDADGNGLSLHRKNFTGPADRPSAWIAAAPTPGIGPDLEGLDVDGDGMPDSWERSHRTNPARTDSAEDPDHDGSGNLSEYIAGTDPQDPQSVLRMDVQRGIGNTIQLHFQAMSGRRYLIQQRTAENSTWETWKTLEGPDAVPAKVELESSAAEGRWYRLQVIMP